MGALIFLKNDDKVVDIPPNRWYYTLRGTPQTSYIPPKKPKEVRAEGFGRPRLSELKSKQVRKNKEDNTYDDC